MTMERGRCGPLFVLSAALLLGAAIAALRRLDVVAVRGGSMAPALLAGDRLLVLRLDRAPRIGEVVLAADPRDRDRELIKRVTAIRGGAVTVRGDAPHASTDSRAFGTLPAAAIRWRAVLRTWPPARAGAIPRLPPRPVLDPVDEGGEPACTFPEALIAGDPR
ncbi:MAG: S26 family signal peptidase [Chloroflexota bacterium]